MLVPAAAVGPDSTFKVVQSLAALGMHVEALNLLRARQSAPRALQEPDQALHEARVGLSIRLSCNLLTEAFMEVTTLFISYHCLRLINQYGCIRPCTSWPSTQCKVAIFLLTGGLKVLREASSRIDAPMT